MFPLRKEDKGKKVEAQGQSPGGGPQMTLSMNHVVWLLNVKVTFFF